MNQGTLRTVARARGLNQSELAKLAGVSRQAVSLWLRNDPDHTDATVDLRSSHLTALADRLGVSLDVLTRPLPGLSAAEREHLTAELLWDHSFEDLDAFLVALAREDDRALARLVEKRGLFEAARIAGDCAWKKFASFKKYLPPRKRSALEKLWNLQRSLGLI
ncbi:MAG: helix-turn-helix transcriptional regulator [Pseudomonadota bacterium]